MRTPVFAAVVAGLLLMWPVDAADAPALRLSRFDLDVSPPVGSRMAYDPVTNVWDLGLRARLEPTGITLRHAVTHRAIEAEVWRGEPSGAVRRSARLRWVDPRRPGVALTALARKAARLAAGS